MLLAVVAIWGIGGVVIKYTLAFFDPVVFLTYRFFIASLVLIPLLFITHKHLWQSLSQLTSRQWLLLSIGGLLGTTVQLLLLFSGLRLTTAMDGILISSTSPILTAIAGFLFLKEHITKREKIGLAIAAVGSIIVVLQPIISSGRIFSGSTLGNLLVLAANLAWVAYIILTKTQLRHHQTPLFLVTFNFFIGLVSMSLILLLTHSPSHLLAISQLPIAGHLGVLYMALISGALAYTLYHRAERSIEASEADVFIYLQPLFGLPLAYFWLREPITIPFLISCAVITVGVSLAQIKTSRRL